jgi:putative phage-type endonuclease
MAMKFVDIVQGTKEWHDWRGNFVTASIIPALLSASPYETAYEAVQYLRGLRAKKVSEWLTRRGNELEDPARKAIEKKMGLFLLPVCGESSKQESMAASLDGHDEYGRPHEIKVPHEKQWNDVKQRGRSSDAYRMYRWQVLCQMYVCESEVGFLHFYNDVGDELITFKITRNAEAEQIMLNAVKNAWNHKLNGTLPTPSSQDIYVPEGLSAHRLLPYARGFKHAKRLYDRATLRFEKLDAERKVMEAHLDSYGPEFQVVEASDVRISRWAQKPKADLELFYSHAAKKTAMSVDEIRGIFDDHRADPNCQTRATVIGLPRRKSVEKPVPKRQTGVKFLEETFSPLGDELSAFHLSTAVWRGVKDQAAAAKKDVETAKASMDHFSAVLNQHGEGFAGFELNGVRITRFEREGGVDVDSAMKELADVSGESVHELHELLESAKGEESRRIRVTDRYTPVQSLVA